MVTSGTTPGWLRKLERPLGWLAVPHISVLLITLQALGFLLVMSNPEWYGQLALLPSAVLHDGQWHRVITFLALPLANDPFWMFFVLWFLYFILNSLEEQWGAFQTTLYVLISLCLTVVFSLGTGFPLTSVKEFESSLFLAAAALFPEMEVRLFMLVPVKMKWLGWLSGAYVLYMFAQGEWLERLYLIAIFSNFLLFFGPAALMSLKNAYRRWNYKRKLKG